MKRIICLSAFIFLTMGSFAQADREAINNVLNNVHQMASDADFDGYFNLYTEDAVFLGTDATERWSIADFKEYAKPAFERGGWTYHMTERNIFVSEDGNSAWFDERLDNEGFGDCRGTGALVKTNGVWKVAQYNLTVPIPNELLRPVAAMIRDLEDDQ